MPLTDYINICDKVREKTATTENIKSGAMPDKINEVYETGKQAEYDRFWDNYQDNGNRTNYEYAFFGSGWNNETFKPKYDIVPVTETFGLLENSRIQGDLAEICEKQGITLDFSKATKFELVFQNSKFTRIGVIDASNGNRFNQVFYSCTNLETIDLLKLTEKIASYNNPFIGCTSLQNIEIDGVIGANISFKDSILLTHDSLMSVINALKNYVTITEKTCYDFSVPPYETEMYKFNKKYEIVEISNNSVEFIGEEYEGNNIWGVGSLGGEDIIPLEDVEGATHIIIYEDGSVTFFIPQEVTTTHTLTLGSTNLAKLTDEEKAIATEKGWTLA